MIWIGLIFVCPAIIPTAHCGMANAYEVVRIEYNFASEAECLDGAKHHFEAIEVDGDRNARFECDPVVGRAKP
jgi:hypothetical protein